MRTFPISKSASKARQAAWWLGLVCLPSVAQAAYTLTTLDAPGATSTQIFDITNDGTVIGSAANATTTFGFTYKAGVFTTLPSPAGALAYAAFDVSSAGDVVGSYYTTTVVDPGGNIVPGPTSGYVYAGGSFTTLTVPGASFVQARGISPDGRYVSGYYQTTQFGAFIYDRTTATFTTIATSPTSLALAQGINQSNVAVGNRLIAGAPNRRVGFTYDISTGTLTDYQLPGASSTSFRDINDSGTLGGFYNDASGSHGFVGSPTVFEIIDMPGSDATFVQGINNSGDLVGFYADINGNFHGLIGTAVPEPSTWALMLFGVAGLAGVMRAKRSQRTNTAA
jgi:uncharacterized membrane protein